MADNTTFLSNLIDAGADAQSNLFVAEFFIGPGVLSDNSKSMNRFQVRVSGFTPPESNQEEYTVNFGPAYVDRPKAFVNVNRNFTLKFRVDANWQLYKDLCLIQAKTMSPGLAWASNTEEDLKMSITIKAYLGSQGDGKFKEVFGTYTPSTIYKYNHCWVQSIKAPTFKNGESGEATVEATFGFMDMEDIHNNVTALK